MKIRNARLEDAAQLLKIYEPAILENATSFETEIPPIEEFAERITEVQETFPWLVMEENGKITGYAYASSHRSKCAYGWSVEASVYVHNDHHRKGIGKKLYLTLFDTLKKQGIVNIFVGITLPNEGSIRLHESMGFEKIGDYKKIGFKLDQWWDVGWWQLRLQEPEKPGEVVPYKEL